MNYNDNDFNQTWETWRRYVIESIKKLDEEVDKVKENINKDRIENTKEFTRLSTTATIYGLVGGTIISLVITIVAGVTISNITKSERDSYNQTTIEQRYQDSENR